MSVIIVCGGRDYFNRFTLSTALDVLHAVDPIALLIEGGANGADKLAREWARANRVNLHTEYAKWDLYGKAAGPKRNAEMIGRLRTWQDIGRQRAFVVAFPGGTGTANMVWQAEQARIPVIKVSRCAQGAVT